MEKPTLTKEQIQASKKNENHPVVQLLSNIQDFSQDYRTRYGALENDNIIKQKFVRDNIGPLAERLNELDDFSMNPLDLVSIWARVCTDFPGYAQYNLAGTISATYATRRIFSPDWRILVPYVAICKSNLPEKLIKDTKNVFHYFSRLGEVRKSLDELNLYTYGTRENFIELARKAYKEGNKEAEEEFGRIEAWHKEHKDDILEQIHENFGTGFSPLFFYMPDDIREKIFPSN